MGLNDPQWGKRRGNSGPPDLEEVLRDFNQKISKFFGQRGGGGDGGSDGGNPEGPSAKGIVVIIFLLLIAWIGSGFYIVDEGHRGVVLRFGKHTETTLPGLRWHIPSPIESVEDVNIGKVRTVEIGYRNNVRSKVLKESLILTDDENIVDIQFAVQYILNSPDNFLFTNRNPEDTVLQVAETAIREVIGNSKMDFVLYEGREEVAAKTTQLMQDILDYYRTGIAINRVTMQNAQPPEQVQAAFDDAVKANQDRERQVNEGEAYANDVIPRAQGVAARLLEEASGYQQKVIASAEGDASRFEQVLVEYAKAPRVTRDRMYIDTVQQVLSNTSKILIDQEKGGGNLLYLPLDKLIQSDPGSGITRSSSGTANQQNETRSFSSDIGSRSRDSLRSREREVR